MEPPSQTRSRTVSLSFSSVPELPSKERAAERAARPALDLIDSNLKLDKYPKIDPNRITPRKNSAESLHSQSVPELTPYEFTPVVQNPFRIRAQSLRSLPFEEQKDCLYFIELFGKKKKPDRNSFSLVREMMSLEIEETSQFGSLFRLDSPSAKLLNFWLRTSQREWYKKICPKEFLKELNTSTGSLVECAEKLFDQISRSFETPSEILDLLKSVRREAEQKFGASLPSNFIYSFLFLRLISPSLWNPKLFGLPPYKGSSSEGCPPRSVIDFVKLLQKQASEPLPDDHEEAASLNPKRQSLIALLQTLI